MKKQKTLIDELTDKIQSWISEPENEMTDWLRGYLVAHRETLKEIERLKKEKKNYGINIR